MEKNFWAKSLLALIQVHQLASTSIKCLGMFHVDAVTQSTSRDKWITFRTKLLKAIHWRGNGKLPNSDNILSMTKSIARWFNSKGLLQHRIHSIGKLNDWNVSENVVVKMVIRESFKVLPTRGSLYISNSCRYHIDDMDQYIKEHIVLLTEYTATCNLSGTKMECKSFLGCIKGSDKLIMSNILLFFKHGNIQLL